jgi:hypothetical protein
MLAACSQAAAALRSGYLKRGATLAELARHRGIKPAGLTRTVAEFNTPAVAGEDHELDCSTGAFNRVSELYAAGTPRVSALVRTSQPFR